MTVKELQPPMADDTDREADRGMAVQDLIDRSCDRRFVEGRWCSCPPGVAPPRAVTCSRSVRNRHCRCPLCLRRQRGTCRTLLNRAGCHRIGGATGDFRDWAEIDARATGIARELGGTGASLSAEMVTTAACDATPRA